MLKAFSGKWNFDPDYNFENKRTETAEGLKETIRMAMLSGEIIKIKYNGGTTPGVVREIIPFRFIKEMKQIIAKCVTAGRVKMFSISKIKIMEFDERLTYAHADKGEDLLAWFTLLMPNQRYSNFTFGADNNLIEVFETAKKGTLVNGNKVIRVSYLETAKIKFLVETDNWHRYFYHPHDAVRFMNYMLKTAELKKAKSKKIKKIA
jgi:hypothetical protein